MILNLKLDPQPWTKDALCTDPSINPDWFFPDYRVSNAYETSTAIKICSNCPVKTQCLNYAIETWPNEGIWGGLRDKQIKILIEKGVTA